MDDAEAMKLVRGGIRRMVIASTLVAWAVALGACSLGGSRAREPSRPQASSLPARPTTSIRLIPVPDALIAACRRAQRRASHPFLCPSGLPRPYRHYLPLRPLGFGAAFLAHRAVVDSSYATDHGRGHPDEFLHFVVGRATEGVPGNARPARLGGRRGLLAPASSVSSYHFHYRLRRYPARVATFALIHGGGGGAWDWHLVAPELREREHDVVTVDLPSDDETAGWWEYADAVVQAIGDRRDVVVVGHSLGGFTAPLVCTRTPVDLLVLVATMIPWPGELFSDWWKNTGYEASGYNDVFYHDVPPELAAETKRRERDETARALQEPWPLEAWPDTPTRYLLCRDDRMFPAVWARRHARERLGIDADEIDGGHYISLSRPRELADRLVAYTWKI